MSLDHTSHFDRPGPDELVPSRYALRVGEIDVLVVSDGVLSLPGAMHAFEQLVERRLVRHRPYPGRSLIPHQRYAERVLGNE